MRNMFIAAAGLGLTLGITSTAIFADADATKQDESLEESAKEAYQDAKTSVFDLLNKNSVDVKFDEGSAVLSDGAKSDIKGLIDSVKKGSTIENVSLAVWADAAAPLRSDQKLSEEQTDLAAKRIENLESYVNTLTKADIDTFDMSKRLGWFADIIGSDEAVTKRTMEDTSRRAEGESDRLVAAKARVFKDKGGASEAVVIVVRDKAELSH